MVIFTPPGDGNCLFHAVSEGLSRNGQTGAWNTAAKLRSIAADAIEQKPEELQDFVVGLEEAVKEVNAGRRRGRKIVGGKI